MKTSSSLSVSLSLAIIALMISVPRVSAQNDNSEAVDSLTHIKAWNFMYEARFENQSVGFRRCGQGETMLLGEFFQTIDLPVPSRAVFCSKDKDGKTSVRSLPGKEAVSAFDIFYSVNETDAEGKIVPKTGENVILSLEYGTSDPYSSGILFIRNTAGDDPKSFLRVSLIISPKVEQDDLRSFSGSDSSPLTASYLLSFDTGDTSDYMKEYQEVFNSALAKNKDGGDYSFLEYACIIGIMDFPSQGVSSSESDEYMSEGRYLDAIPSLNKMLDASKYFWTGDEAEKGSYADACADLAKCYTAIGDLERACYYYEMAYTMDNSYVQEYSLALANMGDIRAKEMEADEIKDAYSKAISDAREALGTFSPFLTIKDFVTIALGIPECGIQSMTVFDGDGEVVLRTDNREGTFSTRLQPLLAEGNTLVLDYDLDHELTQVDSSSLYTNNAVAVLVKKIDGTQDKYRLNVMIPNFITDDTARSLFIHGDIVNRPPSISIVVSSEERGDVPSDPVELFKHAVSVQDDGRYLESLKLMGQVFRALQATDYDQEEYDINSLVNICYEIGFCLTEFSQYDKALYYQGIAYQTGVREYIADYLTSVVGNHEPTSLPVIEKFMSLDQSRDGNMSEENFQSFLKRRKAYYLIDMRRYDDAEAVLEELMKNPDQADWAKSELEYIREIKSE